MKTDNASKTRAEPSWFADRFDGRAPAVVGGGEPDLPDGAFGLTGVEQQIVRRLIRGHSPADIADAFGLSALTTRTHIKRAYAKLHVHSKRDLFARLEGYLVH